MLFYFNHNIILAIVSSLISVTISVTVSSQTCPQNWWPLSISNSFLNDVIKGNNINAVEKISFANDRIDSSADAVYIKNNDIDIPDADAYVSYLTLPAGTYFSSTSFTITFWIYAAQTPAVNANKQARIIDFSDADTKKNGIAVFIQPGTTNTNGAVGIETVVNDGQAQSVSDSGEGFAFKTWKHVAITVKSSSESPAIITVAIYYDGEKKTTAGEINLPAASTNFTTNFIGKGTKVISKDSGLDAYRIKSIANKTYKNKTR